MAIKRAVAQHDPDIQHPFEAELSFLYGTIFIDPRRQASGCDSKNVCIFAEGEVDRCPTGPGVSGRMAIHHRRGGLAQGNVLSSSLLAGRSGSAVADTSALGSMLVPGMEKEG